MYLHSFCPSQVDFPSVLHRKLSIINANPHLQQSVGDLQQKDDDIYVSAAYSAIGCDITNLPLLQCGLEKAEVNYSVPTLFLSECVLTYVHANKYVYIPMLVHRLPDVHTCVYVKG